MRFPDFLIIGAMKAGTTTLYRDLLTNPRIFMPTNKEPSNLTRDHVLTAEGRRHYAELFERARPEQVCGEASTAYTKLPDYPGVPDRAKALLGQNLRLIYIVRNPIARIASHHYHSYISGRFGPDIDEEVRRHPRLIDYTRYAMQVRPWIDLFGRGRVLIVRFEEYVANRRAVVAQVSNFLGIEPAIERLKENKVYNRGDAKPAHVPWLRVIRRSKWYQRYLQPRLPTGVRDRALTLFLPKAPLRPAPPKPETIDYIFRLLSEDLRDLATLLDASHPIWTVETAVDPTHEM